MKLSEDCVPKIEIARMGRERSGEMMINSSIALLQERFTQLQRVKEMREGRALLIRGVWDSERYGPGPGPGPSPHYYYEPPPNYVFFQSEILIHPHGQSAQMKQSSIRSTEAPQVINSWTTGSAVDGAGPTIRLGGSDSDVDTSLHL
ncbi:hypothetical protein NMG60_11009958 [Bertholletia excelsa]